MGTPVVALAYNPKFAGFLELLGSAEGLLDAEAFVRERRLEELDAMLNAAMWAPRLPLEPTERLAAEVREFHLDLLGALT
jgi:polysaccharide pyruvyl transferase WcaK-like protein